MIFKQSSQGLCKVRGYSLFVGGTQPRTCADSKKIWLDLQRNICLAKKRHLHHFYLPPHPQKPNKQTFKAKTLFYWVVQTKKNVVILCNFMIRPGEPTEIFHILWALDIRRTLKPRIKSLAIFTCGHFSEVNQCEYKWLKGKTEMSEFALKTRLFMPINHAYKSRHFGHL